MMCIYYISIVKHFRKTGYNLDIIWQTTCLVFNPKEIREVWISNDFLIFIYQISIEIWIRNTLLHKFLQTDMIFFYQFKVLTVKFGKCFTKFMIPIALLKKFGS